MSFNKHFLQSKHSKRNKHQGSIKFHQKCPQLVKNLQDQFIEEIDYQQQRKQTSSLVVKTQNFDNFKRSSITSLEVNMIKCMTMTNIKVQGLFQKGSSILKLMMDLVMEMKESIIKKDQVKKMMLINGFKKTTNKLISYSV